MLAAGGLAQGVDKVARHLIDEGGDRRFRQERQLRRVARYQIVIKAQGADEGIGTELHVLRDVALHQRDADWFAIRGGPLNLAQALPDQGKQTDQG